MSKLTHNEYPRYIQFCQTASVSLFIQRFVWQIRSNFEVIRKSRITNKTKVLLIFFVTFC